MTDFNAWLEVDDALGVELDSAIRAVRAYNRILRKPSLIKIRRLPTSIVVRIEHKSSDGDVVPGQATVQAKMPVTVFGVFGHPSIPDTDIQPGDIFEMNDMVYRVLTIAKQDGEIQAYCEAGT